jgi:hypothetical protein
MTFKKIEIAGLHSANPIVEVIDAVNANLDSLVTAFEDLNNGQGVIGPAGPKGDTGDRGPAGIQGPQGEPGPAGKDGKDGINGKDGRDGIDGKDGLNGKDGQHGTNGRDGIDGRDGKDGLAGGPGPAGKDGKDGKDGQPGRDGLPGINGKDGKDGLPGRDGVDGKDGRDGVPGKDGAPGIQGLPGKDGKDGINGKDGAQGIQGIPGAAGKDGAQGPAGPQGVAGPAGAQGPIGPKGDTGAMGPVGSPGAMNYKVYAPGRTTGVNTVGRTILSTTFTSTGNPVMIIVTGDANPTSGAGYVILQLARNGGAIGMKVQAEQLNANVNVPYCVQVVDTPAAGTYTYSLQTVGVIGGTWDFGEQDGPTMTIVELTGATGPTGPQGTGIRGFASGYVDAGQFVTLDNLKFTVTTSGARGLSCATVTGTVTLSISGSYAFISGNAGSATTYPGASYTTTPSGSWFGWSFPNAGDGSTYLVNDYTNQKFYRVTLMIGAYYLKNFISIERLG